MKPVTITALSILASVVLVGSALNFSRNSFVETPTTPGANIVAEEGKRIIDITAKGGYSPRKTVAQANVPTSFASRQKIPSTVPPRSRSLQRAIAATYHRKATPLLSFHHSSQELR